MTPARAIPPCPTCGRAYQSKPLTGPDDPRHGSNSTYLNHGCRCDDCKAAHAKYERVRRVRSEAS